MSLLVNTYAPFLVQYWSHIVALGVVYVIVVYIIKLKSDEDENEEKRKAAKKKYVSPDIQAEIKDEEEEADDDSNFTSSLPEDLSHVPLTTFSRYPEKVMVERSKEFYTDMNNRRTVRSYSRRTIPREVIENIVRTAGTAPSGAHTEPWTYVVVEDADMKQRIREIIEDEEEINYKKRMGNQWTTDLKPLRTTWVKDYLTEAPYIILVFKQAYGINPDGTKKNHYYNEISVAIASGILLSAIQRAGLVTLTSTPLNCGPAIRKFLNRPSNEKLTLLLPVGYPSKVCLVPDLQRKPIEDIMVWV